jgi:hypothetical protein
VNASRHMRLAEGFVREAQQTRLTGDPMVVESIASRLAEWEATIEAGAVVYLHADRCTVEPTYLAEDAELRSLLEPGEVALALRPFPNGSGAFVLYGSPEQITELCVGGIVPFLDDLVEDPT